VFFRDVEELIMAIGDYIDKHNETPKPIVWTLKPATFLKRSSVLAKLWIIVNLLAALLAKLLSQGTWTHDYSHHLRDCEESRVACSARHASGVLRSSGVVSTTRAPSNRQSSTYRNRGGMRALDGIANREARMDTP
jgi:hypothetical protein